MGKLNWGLILKLLENLKLSSFNFLQCSYWLTYLYIICSIHDQDPDIKPLVELDSETISTMFPEIPLWVKNPDFDRVCYTSS